VAWTENDLRRSEERNEGVQMVKRVVVPIVGLVLMSATSASIAWAQTAPSTTHSGTVPILVVPIAEAMMQPKSGSQVTGTVTFVQEGSQVLVIVDVHGFAPFSTHGFHIHESGDCSAPDGMSAGGHFNPGGHQHAGPTTPDRHAGDLGNLETAGTGRAYRWMFVDGITLDKGTTGVLGRSVIIHETMDDLTSQPAGNSGARVACGTIDVYLSSGGSGQSSSGSGQMK
jgi:superoxide dismutase, Cu-Zn family